MGRRLAAAASGVAALAIVALAAGAAGDLDRSFDGDGKVVTDFGGSELGHDVVVQTDGKIVMVGETLSESGGPPPGFVLARYNRNGSLDASFGSGGKVRTEFGVVAWGYALAIQRDGKLVAVGQGAAPGEPNLNFALARYNPDGSLDASFDGDGKITTDFGFTDFAAGVAIQPDGKIVAVGSARSARALQTGEFAAARYLPNGSLDPTFGGGGRVVTSLSSVEDAAYDVALQPDGKLVLGGVAGFSTSTEPNFGLARYNPNGSLDGSFDGDGIAVTATHAWGNDVVLQADGKILIAGGPIVRYRPDGAVDSTFGESGKVAFPDLSVSALALQADRKVLAAGLTGAAPGDFGVARLLSATGAPDPRFGTNGRIVTDISNSVDLVAGAALQRDGRLLVAGSTARPAPYDFALVRYLGDPPTCVVPNVRKATLRVARSRIARARCTVGRITKKVSRRVKKGRVISQRPRAGTRLPMRGKVHLVVSRGARRR